MSARRLSHMASAFFATGLLFSLITPVKTAIACTAFSFNDVGRTFVAKNYDWLPLHGHGAVFVNKRNVAKRAQTLRTKNSVEWVSRWGSVTFSQVGLEFPYSGMNERGLVVELLMLKETQHIDETDPRPALNEAQWVQYQLDRYSTVSQVLSHIDEIRVEQAFLGVHYLICDRQGECGVFEFIGNGVRAYSGTELTTKVVTNTPQADALAAFDKRSRLKKPKPIVRAMNQSPAYASQESLTRFLQAAELLSKRDDSKLPPRAFAFNVLQQVEMASWLRTHWSIVYDTDAREIEFRTSTETAVKRISFDEIDFSCQKGALISDMNLADGDLITKRLKRYTAKAQRELVGLNWWLMASDLLALAADYPKRHTRCME